MKKFNLSQKEQLSKNVFAFIRKNKTVFFNRMNFERKYIENKDSFFLLEKIVKKMEQKTPEMKFNTPPLKKVRAEITLKCNCNCDYCLVYKNPLEQLNSSMDETTAKKIISFYQKNIKGGSLMIIGGEPLLNWPIVKLFIKNIMDPIKIFTNGTIINQDIIDTLKQNRNVELRISLDGRRVENKMRKLPNKEEIYPLVVKNLRIFQKNKCKVGIACLCNGRNIDKISDIVKFFVRELKVKYLGISFPHYIYRDSSGINDLDIEKYTEQMIKIFDFVVRNQVYVDQLAKRFTPLVTGNFRFYGCKSLGEQKTFYPNGKETFCTKIDSLENSHQYNLHYFQNVIPINNKFCQNCSAIGICGGGCFWDGIVRFNNGVDERECILNNLLLDYFLWKIYVCDRKRIPLEKEFGCLISK